MLGNRIAIVVAAALVALPLVSCSEEGATPTAAGEVVASHGATGVDWEREWEQAFARARAEGKVVVVDFYADWCVWCKAMDSTTFADSKVNGVLATRTVPLKLDTDRGGRELAVRYRISSLPTVVVFGADGSELGRIPGYASPGSFVESLTKILPREG